MSSLEPNNNVDELLREINEEMGLGMLMPNEGVPEGMEAMWIHPAPQGRPTILRSIPIAAKNKKRSPSRKKANSSIARATQTDPDPVDTDAAPPIQRFRIADPKDCVIAAFDNVIAPNIFGARSVLTTLRQHIFRRAVGEFAVKDLNERGMNGAIGLEDIVSVTIKACEKAGIDLHL